MTKKPSAFQNFVNTVKFAVSAMDGDGLTPAKLSELFKLASKRGISKERVMIEVHRLNHNRRHNLITSQEATIPTQRDERTGRYREIEDEDVFMHAMRFWERDFFSQSRVQKIHDLKTKYQMKKNTVGFDDTGRDHKSRQNFVYFKGQDDKRCNCDPVLNDTIDFVVSKLKSEFLTQAEGVSLDALVRSDTLPSSVFMLRYEKGYEHGAWWHIDAETVFATVIVTLSDDSDGLLIHPGSIQDVHAELEHAEDEIKESGRLARAREFAVHKGGAICFRPKVAHMAECKKRSYDRVVLTMFF